MSEFEFAEPSTAPGSQNPATGEALPTVEWSRAEDVAAAVARGRAAQGAWAARPASERNDALRALGRSILEDRASVATLMSQETGRSPTDCLLGEVVFLMDAIEAAIRVCAAATAPERIRISALDFPGKRVMVEAVPRGVIAIIAPWNYPLANFYKSLFPALLAGNAVVMKPSEHTPRTGAWLAEKCREIFPEDLVQVVQGEGPIGQALLRAGVDGVVFTGSVATGRKVSAEAGSLLIPCSVELGGKDAAIVLADCDLERTVAGIAYWGLHNAGQNCAGIERVYVENAVADAFVARLGRTFDQLHVFPEGGDIGTLQNEAQRRIVESHVEDAVASGATLVSGGKRTGPGLGYRPTLLDHCTQEMRVIQEETFGPVIAVVRVESAEEAVRLANDSNYGLGGSVWTSDLDRGERLVRQMHVGVAAVNNHAITGTMPETPWSGTRATGPGVAMSKHAYPTFVRRRTVLVDSNRKPDPWWFPANADLDAFADAVCEKSLGSFSAIFRLLGLLGKRVRAVQTLTRRG
jgi:acyl-CoA reductase-like NAD-dependent aldehyde dehydrogenase